ncbi:MmcQ/YjbR family DNA-binding protein [Yinghuangia soli]|uniref:MmcQ/YjbR family DNA-binding protein n=1 Tax=Yinghuangia soli TaxID=2908204 RepID=A0AA41PYN9_9ACTN|nr:MmcQ/YjbR family DNA-binding protein [Yinghuangia soli]MCF2527259.1 MmcQ/YjbR family DNA-binding protein [Yinghuangia soli]
MSTEAAMAQGKAGQAGRAGRPGKGKAVTNAELRSMLLALPEAEEVMVEAWGHPTYRVRNKMFASTSEGSPTVCLKAAKETQQALLASDPATFTFPAYVGRHGWVDVALATVDRGELAELVAEAWRLTAPKRLVKAYDEENALPRP